MQKAAELANLPTEMDWELRVYFLDDPAMAQTIAIELRNSDRSRLALGAASPTEEVDANGNVTLNFFANYRALASGVRPGVAKADAIFMINYN